MSEPTGKCEICGEPMPAGEEMFKFHGYSGECPKPPLKKKTETVIAWGCWSNEMPIAEQGQCGVLHGRLFKTHEDAKNFYSNNYHAHPDDPIVKVTVELTNQS